MCFAVSIGVEAVPEHTGCRGRHFPGRRDQHDGHVQADGRWRDRRPTRTGAISQQQHGRGGPAVEWADDVLSGARRAGSVAVRRAREKDVLVQPRNGHDQQRGAPAVRQETRSRRLRQVGQVRGRRGRVTMRSWSPVVRTSGPERGKTLPDES